MSQQPVPPLGGRGTAAGDDETEGMPTRFGKYTLLRRLARGGMAELFLAIQKSVANFEKLIVIKRILPSMNQDRAFIEMLLHEARIAATLSHPNIVQIFDVGQADGQYFIAMEHVHGEDLRSIVRQMKRKDVLEFPLEHALAIILGMCAGLSFAHDKRDLEGNHLGIVHRDISPQNIVVTFAGDVKIVDFGIAKSDSRAVGEITKSGKLKGKVPYMSPEQARGEDLDARSDLFATGTMLFELTTGKRLFKGQSEYETLKLICERDYPRPSDVHPEYPPELEKIVMRALAKDPAERYQSARAMQGDLEMFVRKNQIAVSSLALNQFMQSLFEEKLAIQKEALLQGKHLADIIESREAQSSLADNSGAIFPSAGSIPVADRSSQHHMPVSSPGTGSLSMPPAAAHTVTDMSSGRPARSNAPIIAAAVGALLVVGGVLAGAGYVFAKRRAEAHNPSPANSTSSVASASAGPAAAAAKGSLVVTSDPPGASIWINGDLRSELTPATIGQLPTGVALDVKLTMDGFEQARQKVTLEDSKPADVRVELKKGSVIADVKVTPDVPNAVFAIDGKPVTGPRIEAISSGITHKLTVSAPGYSDANVTFTGSPLETKRLDVTLEKAHGWTPPPFVPPTSRTTTTPTTNPPAPVGSGKLNVGASGGWCNVTIDGAPRGATPVAGVELPAGPHKVTCTTAEGKVQATVVVVNPGETARFKFTL